MVSDECVLSSIAMVFCHVLGLGSVLTAACVNEKCHAVFKMLKAEQEYLAHVFLYKKDSAVLIA